MRDHSCTLPIKLQQTNRNSTANNSNDDSTFFSLQQKAAAWTWHLRTGGGLLSSSSSSSSSSSLHARIKLAPSMSRFHAESIAASAAARNDDGDDDDDAKEEYKSPALFDALELASFALHLDRTLVCSSLRTHSMPHFPNPTSLSFSHSYDELEEERAGPKKARGRRWKQKLIDGIKKMAIPFR